ncbi:MAG: hypothetical protein COA88_13575 [Kordia sp.]|nr:MAG: hypothetical protein COA88_13575 [Kordia sp.]
MCKRKTNNLKKKLTFVLLFIIITIGVCGYIAGNSILPYSIIKPHRISENLSPDSLNLKSSNIDIKVDENINLKGYWIQSTQDETKAIMILLHGIGGCKEHFLGLAKKLANKGIATIVFDSRAHGKSGGEYCTYGYKEKKDISKIINYIKSKAPVLPIGIWGNSMGGAIAIQALEEDKRLDFGIIESTFTALDQIVYDYQKRHLKGIGVKILTDFALKRAGEIGDFDPDMVKPINSVKNIEQPVLISHGDSDENISFHYGKALFDELKSKHKKFIKVKGGGHYDLSSKGGLNYNQTIFDFIENSIEKSLHITTPINNTGFGALSQV